MEENKVIFSSALDKLIKKSAKEWKEDSVIDFTEVLDKVKDGEGEVIQRQYNKSVCLTLISEDKEEYDLTYDLEPSSSHFAVGAKIPAKDLKLVHLIYIGENPDFKGKECYKYRVNKPQFIKIDPTDPFAFLRKKN